ncbi:hypothetical protein AWZ03_015508, partial [Drosophila navojoa]
MHYKKARQRFACTVYSILFVWLALTFMQIAVIALLMDARHFFYRNYYISLIFFGVGILLFALFMLFETLRFISGVNFVLAIII